MTEHTLKLDTDNFVDTSRHIDTWSDKYVTNQERKWFATHLENNIRLLKKEYYKAKDKDNEYADTRPTPVRTDEHLQYRGPNGEWQSLDVTREKHWVM